MHTIHLDAIRRFEGFTARATPDYAQLSNGYGTRARFAGEVIDKAEAERRFRAEIADARQIVERFAPTADEGTKAALTSLTFNAGSAWTRSGLGQAVARGDLDTARTLFLQYDKAGGKALPGLTARRAEEAQWIGQAGGTDQMSPSAVGQSITAAAPETTAGAAPSFTTVAGPMAKTAIPARLAFADASATVPSMIDTAMPDAAAARHTLLPSSSSSGTSALGSTSLGSLSLDALRARWQAERAAMLAHTASSTNRVGPTQANTLTTLALQALTQQVQVPSAADGSQQSSTTTA